MTAKTLQMSEALHAYLLANSLRETPVPPLPEPMTMW